MKVAPTDPRDTDWEDDAPVFRVTFFDLAPGAAPPPDRGVNTDEWEVRDADVHEAVAWARDRAGPARTWQMHVLVSSRDGRIGAPGLVRLCGEDPNR